MLNFKLINAALMLPYGSLWWCIYDDDIDLEMQSISWNMQNNSFYPVKIESVWSIHIPNVRH